MWWLPDMVIVVLTRTVVEVVVWVICLFELYKLAVIVFHP